MRKSCSTKRPSEVKAVSEAPTNNDMYEASEYTPDYGARERALQLLADVKKREEEQGCAT